MGKGTSVVALIPFYVANNPYFIFIHTFYLLYRISWCFYTKLLYYLITLTLLSDLNLPWLLWQWHANGGNKSLSVICIGSRCLKLVHTKLSIIMRSRWQTSIPWYSQLHRLHLMVDTWSPHFYSFKLFIIWLQFNLI